MVNFSCIKPRLSTVTTALPEVGMTAEAKPTSWKGLFSIFMATVWFSSFLLCRLLGK